MGWANASNTPFRLYKHFNHEGGIATPVSMPQFDENAEANELLASAEALLRWVLEAYPEVV